jgi:response regulator RpfG family c-di-GMP phosphodiesterase
MIFINRLEYQQMVRDEEYRLLYLSDEITSFLTQPKYDLERIIYSYDQSNDKTSLEGDMNFYLKQFNYIYRVEFLDADGDVEIVYPNNPRRVNINLSSHQIYRESIKNLSKLNPFYIGDTFYDSETQQISIYVSGLTDEETLVVGYISVDSIFSIIEESEIDNEVAVIDEFGTYIFNTVESLVEQQSVDPYSYEILNGEIENGKKYEIRRTEKFMYTRQIEDSNWHLILYGYEQSNTRIGLILILLILFLIIVQVAGYLTVVKKSFNPFASFLNKVTNYSMNDSKSRIDTANDFDEFKEVYTKISSISQYIKVRENENVRQMEIIEENYFSTLRSICETLSEKEFGKVKNLAQIVQHSQTIGEALSFDAEQLRSLRAGAYLHDLGKIFIDSSLLEKKEFTDDEYELVKQHSYDGFKMLSKLSGYQNLLDIILYHHERYDGNGYPNQLSGESIPLQARIVSIAEGFVAMTNKRVYRDKIYTIHEAFQELRELKGTQYDPYLVEEFIVAYQRKHLSHQKNGSN